MPRPIPTTILFDADEVMQTWMYDHRTLFAALVDPDADVDAFITDIYAAEAPCLSCLDVRAPHLAPVLARWSNSKTVADVLTIFTAETAPPYTNYNRLAII